MYLSLIMYLPVTHYVLTCHSLTVGWDPRVLRRVEGGTGRVRGGSEEGHGVNETYTRAA